MTEAARWLIVESLLDAALELEPEARIGYILEACQGDEALEAEVRDLLAEVERPGPLDQPIAELAEAAVQPGEALGAGQRVGAWRLIEPLGSGGMGRVFVAHREGGDFDQQAAVKLLRWEMATPELVARFRTERQILAGLDHPSIARLIDGGVTDEGIPFLVMERVEGLPIDAYCDEHAQPLEARLRLMLEVCDAVRAAHAQLVIHRDLKPSNILVTAEGQVRLLDFGVGKFLEGSTVAGASTWASTHTAGQLAPATPAYAAPEQIEGQPMSVATDVYGLGVVLFELLTGRRPFETESRAPHDVVRQVLETEPPPPSRSVEDGGFLRPKTMRGDLDNIVLAALRKEPERRYASVEAFAADLRRFLEGRPVAASPSSLVYRARKLVGRHRAASALTAVLLIGAIIAGIAITTSARLARLEASRAQATADFLERTLIDANLQSDTAGDDSLSSLLDRALPRVDVELADHPRVRARVRNLLAQALQGVGRQEEAGQLHQRALEEAITFHGADSPLVGSALVGLANSDPADGSPQQLERLEQALAIMDAHYGRLSNQTMEILNLQGHAYTSANQLDKGEAAYREALAIAREVLGPNDPWSATGLANLGGLLRRLGRFDEAIETLEKALALYVEAVGETAYIALSIRNNLALTLAEAGRLAEAEDTYRETIALRQAKLGHDHPLVGGTLTNLGRLLMDQGRFEQAAAPIRRAAEIMRANAPEDGFSRRASEINLATLLLELGEREEAVALYDAALQAFSEQLGEDHPAALRTGWLLGEARRRQGRHEAARVLLERQAGDSLPAGDVRIADRLLSLGRLGIDTGDPRAAREHLEQALAIYGVHLDAEHWRLVETRAELTLLEDGEVRRKAIRPLQEQLLAVLPPDNWRLQRLAFLARRDE